MSGYIRQVNASDGSPITAPSTVVLGVQSFAVYANDAAFETDLGRSGQAGDAYFNSTDQQVRYYKDGAWEYHEADESVYDNATSGLAATDVQGAIDEVEARVDTNETDISTAQADIIANASDISDIRTTQGTSDGDTDLGTFTGSTISDNGSVKAGMQELETAHEAHTGATSAHGATGNLFGLGDDPSFTSTGGIKMPAGTTAQRPTPTNGHLRYNSDLSIFEGYQGGSWGAIGGGDGGAGGKNYILNPSAETDTTNVANTATTGSWTIARTTTAAELPEETIGTAFKISGSSLTVGDTVEWAIESTGIDDADGGRMGWWEVKVLDISGSINGQYSGQVYNVTTASYVGDEDTVTGTGLINGRVPLIATNDYEFHLKAETASPSNIGLSSVTIEPVSQSLASLGGWKQYDESVLTFSNTPTGWSLVRAVAVPYKDPVTGIWRLRFNVDASITSGTTGTFDFDGVVFKTGTVQSVTVAGNGGWSLGQTTSGGDTVTVLLEVNNSSVRVSGDVELDSKPTWADWDNTAPTASDVQYENDRAQANSSNGQTVTDGSPIIYETVVKNTHGSYDNTTGLFTAKVAGTYRVSGYVSLSSATNCRIGIEKNGTLLVRGPFTTNGYGYISADIDVDAGETIGIENATGSSITLFGLSTINYMSISRVSDYSARKASLPFSDIADDTQQYLLPRYQTETVTADGDFSAGEIVCLRIGNLVQITSTTGLTHGSGNSLNTSSGLIPADYRPTTATQFNICYHDATSAIGVEVNTAGRLQLFFRDDSGSVNRSSTGIPVNISYVIS